MFKRVLACLGVILVYAWSVYLMDHLYEEPTVIEIPTIIEAPVVVEKEVVVVETEIVEVVEYKHTRTPTPIQECYFTADGAYMICKLEKAVK